jgi:PAS domain S-box-containing protein
LVSDTDGKPLYVVAVGRDLSARRQAEAKLSHERDIFQTLFEDHTDFVYFKDKEARFYRVSDRFCDLFGLKKEDIVGKTDLELFPEELAAETYSDDLRVIKTGISIINKEEHDHATWVLTTKTPWRDRDGNIIGLFGISRDITERKRIDLALQESERRFRSLAENSQDYIMRYDAQCRHLYENPAALRVSGFTPENIIGKTHREAGFDEHLCDLWEGKIKQVFATGKPDQHVFEWEGPEGKVYLDLRLFPEIGHDGKVDTVLGVSRDITKIKRAGEELAEHQSELEKLVEERTRELQSSIGRLQKAKIHYRTVADFTYDWEYWESPEGKMIYVSPSFKRITGYPVEKLIDNPGFIMQMIIDKDKGIWEEHDLGKCREKREDNIQFRIRRRDGEVRWIEHVCQQVYDPVEGFLGFRASNRDITDRKVIEAARLESEKKYESLVENANEMIVVSQGKHVKYFNPQAVKLTGYTAEDFASRPFIEFIHPDDHDTVLREYQARLSGEKTTARYTIRFITKSGEVRWSLVNSALIQWEGKPATLVMNTDITERKMAEESLQKSTDSLKEAQRIAHIGNWTWNILTNDLQWSDEIYRIFGLEPQQFEGNYEAFLASVHPDDREYVKEAVTAALNDKDQEYSIDHRVIRPDGSVRFVHELAEINWDETDRPISMIGTVQDITEQRAVQEALKESEAKSRGILEAIPDMMFQIDRAGTYLSYHAINGDLLYLPPEEFLGKKVSEVMPPELSKVIMGFVDKTLKECEIQIFDYELPIDAKLRQFEVRMACCGRGSVLAIVRDITERQRAELATTLQGRLLGDILAARDTRQALRVGLIELAEFFDWEYAEVWVPNEEINGVKKTEQWHVPDDNMRKYAELSAEMTLVEGQGLAGRVYANRRLEHCESIGTWAQTDDARAKAFRRIGLKEALGVPVLAGDKIIAVFCFFTTMARDYQEKTEELITPITLQIATAIQFRNAAEQYLHILESAPSPMLIASPDGTILYSSGEACNLFGYESKELIGNKVEMLIPEKMRSKHVGQRAGFSDTGIRKIGRGMELFGLKKDGTEIPVDVSLNAHKTLYGSRIIVSIVDLREQKRNLAALKSYSKRLQALTHHLQNVTEHERKSIARDLHDDMGQVLTALKMELSLLRSTMSQDMEEERRLELDEDFLSINDTIDKALDRLGKVITKLRPEVLDNLGLVAGLEWQTKEFSELHDIECRFQSNYETIDIENEIGIVVYRVVQESLTNIARHAKASAVEVKLFGSNESIRVEVSDNGIGMPQSDRPESIESFGILGMRERISTLEGNFEIKSKPGEGTTISFEIPLAIRETDLD